MSLRLAIAEADLETLNVSEFCRVHGVGRTQFYEIRKRFLAEGVDGLENRSTAPLNPHGRISVAVEEEIVRLRKELVGDGFDAGPATIRTLLQRDPQFQTAVPSEATIWRVLDRRGFVEKNAKKRPRKSWKSFAADRRNELWQIDASIWALADGTRVEIIDLIDDCTRLALGSVVVMKSTTAPQALESVLQAGERWGLPAKVLSDNGRPFVAIASGLHAIGIATTNSAPFHPQTCGKVERFHQTLKKYLAKQNPAATTVSELQAQVDTFIEYYNTVRPHRSLNRQTPKHVWDRTPTSGPSSTPIGEKPRVYQGTVLYTGQTSAGNHRIAVGKQYLGQTTTTVRTVNKAHVFIDGTLIRTATITPGTTSTSHQRQ